MGVSAGRVLLIPKGDWNAETTYTGLDWVRHNGASWVCKNTCTNIEPTEANADNWQIMSRDGQKGTEITVDAEISDQSENPVQNKVIKKYVDEHTPEIADMTGATSTQNGDHGLVPAPQMGDEKKALLGDGTWGSVDSILTYKTKEEYDSAVANNEIPDGAKVIKEYDDGDTTVIIGVDTAMSDTSENPVQNKVIKKYVDDKALKPDGKSMSVDESGTLTINLDGATITLDEAKNVIKLADTLKEKIDGAFPAANLIDNLTTTEAGFGLDARQGKALDDKVTEINGSLEKVFYSTKEAIDANNADFGITHMPPNSNYDASTNNPFPNFHTILLTIPFVNSSSGYVVQIGVSIASQYNGKLAVRVKDSGNWQVWNIITGTST